MDTECVSELDYERAVNTGVREEDLVRHGQGAELLGSGSSKDRVRDRFYSWNLGF